MSKRFCAAMGGVTNPGDAERALGHPADRDHEPPGCERGDEAQSDGYLVACGCPILALRPRMSGNDVPEENVVLEAELREHPMNDRGRRLGGPGAGELALRRERDSRDPRTAVSRSLADEKDSCIPSRFEVRRQAFAA